MSIAGSCPPRRSSAAASASPSEPGSRSRTRAATRCRWPLRGRRARGGRLLRVAQPRRALVAPGRVRVREQQRGRARLRRWRVPHLGVGRRRPHEDPGDLRDPGRDGRRARRGGCATTWPPARSRTPARARARTSSTSPRPASPARSRCGRTCPPAPPRSRWPGTTRAWPASTRPGTASTTRCFGYARELLASGDISQDDLTKLDAQVSERVAEARQFALDSPRPTPESALDHVFA